MGRLTKSEIEANLLRGIELEWRDNAQKKKKLKLETAESRRLFQFLLGSDVRKPTELPEAFIAGLAAALNGEGDPGEGSRGVATDSGASVWRLHSIETEGVGGINLFGGARFTYAFDGESWLAEGPNGSGKSSLIGAIIWALTGTRPRDLADVKADESRPVYSLSDENIPEREIGVWPPLAAFPSRASDLVTAPRVSVTLHFCDSDGNRATLSRTLDGGITSEHRSPGFSVPEILVEAGLLMPARLASMRFGDKDSQLATSIQRLTGLDDLISIGLLCEGLCNTGREYLSYKKKELSLAKADFQANMQDVRAELRKIQRDIPEYSVLDTDGDSGELAALGKELSRKSTELTMVVAGDLGAGLDLRLPATQQAVAAAIIAAKQDLTDGLSSIGYWNTLDLIATEMTDGKVEELARAVSKAKHDAKEALSILQKMESDNKYQLKALAAAWHASHALGDIENCPLCDHRLEQEGLRKELDDLRAAGVAATKDFSDNERSIIAQLVLALPDKLRNIDMWSISKSPKRSLTDAIRRKYAENSRYSGTLTKYRVLVEASLESLPGEDFEEAISLDVDHRLRAIFAKVELVQRLIRVRTWAISEKNGIESWWNALVKRPQNPDEHRGENLGYSQGTEVENWSSHLDRLSRALAEAEPYRLGAAALRRAWVNGRACREVEVELETRNAVKEAISPLKLLGGLAEAQVRDTIGDLTKRVEEILERTLIADKVQFRTTSFNKRDGVSVRASVSPEIVFDASLVANSSWMRAVLWAFIFAIREEAVEQLGQDAFPLLALDDPQATFDDQHRHRWSQQIASLQNGPSHVQVIIVTHDHNFIELIRYSGVTGRSALISAAGPDIGSISIFDGDRLEKLWSKAERSRLDEDARAYLSAARIQVETVLRIMLRGEGPEINSVANGLVIGACRTKLEHLRNQGKSPWDKNAIDKLIKNLNKENVCIKHLEMSHHSSVDRLGMAEAKDVWNYLKSTLLSVLHEAFLTQREHFRLHGGLNKLHAAASVLSLPDGYASEVRLIPLKIVGRAAALTDGKLADGRLNVSEYDESSSRRIVLAQHTAYRLTASTLEPVANAGDILLVKEGAKATANSLVVACTEDRLFARRLQFAANHSDVQVLVAQTNNPRKIPPPVIAQQSTSQLRKVVGVIYDRSHWNSTQTENEVVGISGTSEFTRLVSGSLGLVEVVGNSAEPIALDGQYIIVGPESSAGHSLTSQAGTAVIAEDAEGNRYLKRLQTTDSGQIVLESLDASGEHGPLVMKPGDRDAVGAGTIARVWPVAGILFELPS